MPFDRPLPIPVAIPTRETRSSERQTFTRFFAAGELDNHDLNTGAPERAVHSQLASL